MSQQEASETTRLLDPQQHQYVFGSSLARERKRRVRQFQCCVCTLFLIAFAAAVVITVAYTINLPLEHETSSTQANITLPPINETSVPIESFLILFDTLSWPIDDKIRNKTFENLDDLRQAVIEGKKELDEKDRIENDSPSLKIDTPSYRHQKVMSTSEKARNISRKGYEIEGATRFLQRNKNNRTAVKPVCPKNFTDGFLIEMCSNTSIHCNILQKYRSYNGSCNNLNKPSTYGVAYRPFRRALPPDYADGISKPRISKSGQMLPKARRVSKEIHRPYYREDSKFSVMLAVWGQFLDHDITATALSQKQNGSSISCCQIDSVLSPDCFPLFLEKTDPYFAQFNVTCMEFVRSAPAPTCCIGPREQMNQATAFIDGSVIYGNDESKAILLRRMNKGLLKMYITEDNRTLLPLSEDMSDGCNRAEEGSRGRYCFLTGDDRANENLHLTSMHLIWARQHNRLARNLSDLNPHWNDERIFQETRRILAAQMQHITYNEFLPILLGEKVITKYELTPKEQGYFTKYNETLDPSIANEFAAAAFRFAHTIIPGLVKLLARDSSSPEFIQIHKMLFDPFRLYQNGELDRALRGAMYTGLEASDRYFSNELKSHLFERNSEYTSEPLMCGLDLVSLNIQRGRDHGLPGYIYWKEHCGFKKTRSFDDLADVIDRSTLEDIRATYREVEDIDLYTGALSEKPIRGSILGPTLTCLILDQFIRIKYGDRFWYENPQKPQGFNLGQLDEIRKTSLAGVICDNADYLESVQPLVMERPRRNNYNVACSEIPKINLTFWKENLEHLSVLTHNLQIKVIN